MIVEWLLDLADGFVAWFFRLFDGLDVPEWIAGPPAYVYDFFGTLHSLGVWVPWFVMSSVAAVVLTVYGVGFIVKIVKQVLAHVPVFGGAG